MRLSKVRGAFVISFIIAAGATTAYAGDACKNVQFQLINKRDARIRLMSVDYDRDVAARNPRHEDINPNLECASGATCTTNGDDLRDSEGEILDNFVFHFEEQEEDGDWSNTDWRTQPKVPDKKKCTANRTYGDSKTKPWTIN